MAPLKAVSVIKPWPVILSVGRQSALDLNAIMTSEWVYNVPPEVARLSNYPTIIGVCTCLTAIMMVVICLRGYVRVMMLKHFGRDDWTILFSAVSHARGMLVL